LQEAGEEIRPMKLSVGGGGESGADVRKRAKLTREKVFHQGS